MVAVFSSGTRRGECRWPATSLQPINPRRTTRRPRHGRQGLSTRQADRQAGLCDRPWHPQRLGQGAGRAQGRRGQGRQEQGQTDAAKAKLLAPVPYPSAIYCAGANYQDHANEMAAKDNRPPPPDPHTLGLESWHFIKASRAIANPGATIKISDLFEEDGLGGRACRGHRQGSQERAR